MASSHINNLSALTKGFAFGLLPVLAVLGFLSVMKTPAQPNADRAELDLAMLLPSRQQKEIPWVVLDASQVASGATVPADSNVIFHVPVEIEPINREVLLGGRGSSVRYWGYCLPLNYDPKLVQSRQGFPGLMFLSEKERKAQQAAASSSVARRSIYNIQEASDSIAAEKAAKKTQMKNQLNTFDPGSLCFIMSEAALPIGLDRDGDLLNDKAEATMNTDEFNPDTDGDGLNDGIEAQGGTQPLVRDTDSDGLIDGIEDANLNGRQDPGETDPRNKDSDRDGLCDGLCTVRVGNDQIIELGEDTNLNGQIDAGETDPLNRISDPTSVDDYDAVYRCLFGDTSVCPS